MLRVLNSMVVSLTNNDPQPVARSVLRNVRASAWTLIPTKTTAVAAKTSARKAPSAKAAAATLKARRSARVLVPVGTSSRATAGHRTPVLASPTTTLES